jgi:hypothetical protein
MSGGVCGRRIPVYGRDIDAGPIHYETCEETKATSDGLACRSCGRLLRTPADYDPTPYELDTSGESGAETLERGMREARRVK